MTADRLTEPVPSSQPSVQADHAPPLSDLPRSLLRSVATRLARLGRDRRRLMRIGLAVLVLAAAAWLFGGRMVGWYHWHTGRGELAADHSGRAFAELQQALAVWPDDAEVQLVTAQAARRSGALDAADQLLTKCQAAPAPPNGVVLERVLLRACRGEVDEVARFCMTLLDQGHPDSALIAEALAQGYIAVLRLPDASSVIEGWLERSPDHPQALFLKGYVQTQAGNQHEAILHFRRVVEQDPERDDARLQLAALHLDLGQAREALDHLEFLRRRLPENVMVHVRLARCFDLLGRQDEAVALLDGVLQRQPHLTAALMARGKLALRAQDLEAAERHLREACRRDPGSYEAWYQIMQCMRAQGKRADADRAIERMAQIEKDAARLREIATTSIGLRPHDAALHAEVGTILLRGGAPEQGERWLQAALRLDPQHAPAHEALARHYQAIGQWGKAERHRQFTASSGEKKR